ncbi:MAG TPA: NAD(P)H-dependent glycerol-3-phosphate dehydrogenase [Rickettsiales bacterium]|nr:NAD(P)H-dependent glycerol-3-phosphate dehydrogenase [Rickettsiales bacterium]
MTNQATSIGVISAGGWGTALAIAANRAGSRVSMYSANPNVLESIRRNRTNDVYLPDVFIDPAITVSDKLAEICASDMIILVVPSQHVRSTCIWLSDQLPITTPVIIATKGIERGSLALMSEVVGSILPKNPLAILSGPNFAIEVARGLPTATTIACQDAYLAKQIIYAIGGKFFRPYYTDDVIGTQIGGSVKNVIAIACGIAIGRGFGENAKAGLITRGITEMARLCNAKGGRQETLMGFSGVGDLILTCGSRMSRNMSLGIEIGKQKESVRTIIENRQSKLAEGVATADSVNELASSLGISMPICHAVQSIISGSASIDEAIAALLERPFATEMA